MPPKNKNKGKKGIRTNPQEDPRVIRNREQAKKADAKKLKIALKKLTKEQKQNKKTVPSSANYGTDNQEPLQHETRGEGSEIEEDINLPYSSCNEPSTSRTIGQQVNQQIDSSETSKETGNDCASPKEESITKRKPLYLKIRKMIPERKKLSSNIAETEQDCSQSIQLNYSDDKRLHKGEHAKTQVEAENEKIAEIRTPKATKSMEFASNTSKNVPPKVHKKATEDLTNKRNILQQKLKTFETDMQSLDEQEKKLSPSVKEKTMAIRGGIKVLATDKSVKNSDKKGSIYSCYTPDKKIIYIGDETIKIYLLVDQGSQVVCNSRRRPVIDLVQNVETCSGTLEGHATENPDENIKIDSEKYDKTTSDTKCDLSSASEFSSLNCQTVDDQTTDNPGKDILIDSEQHDKTATDTKCSSSSISKYSKEKDASGINSTQEKMRELCNDYLKDFHSASKKFKTRVENHIKIDSLKSSEI
ncbi:hypothetical protein AVEN_51715-1 [Araneus ventricosus]|uniref:Uncharacterized protein n=1 Tax=Araneus ventricosus TaxID=182803 RepID=A0A4Y2GHT3_ARAVE|nr:hypothetical protein AVEN_51715-1 [Araneus ventricosus]